MKRFVRIRMILMILILSERDEVNRRVEDFVSRETKKWVEDPFV